MLGKRWRYSKFRKLLRKKRATSAIIAGVLTLIAVVALTLYFLAEDDATKDWVETVWFYDLNSKKLYEVKAGTIPPAPAPSGKDDKGRDAGVRAHVYGCGGCGETYISHLEMFPQVEKATVDGTGRIHAIGEIKPDGVNWMNPRSPGSKEEAKRLRKAPRTQCGDRPIVQCFPGNTVRFTTQ